LKPGLGVAFGIVLGTAGLGLAPPAVAHDHDSDACERCEKVMRQRGGGSGMRMMGGMSAGHKHADLVIQPYQSMTRNALYTLIGMEMVKQDARGWKGGFGMYGGMDLGVTNQSNLFQYGGGLLGKDFTAGPLSLTTGVLLGFGKTSDILPAVLPAGIQNTYVFGVVAPRVGLAWRVYDRMQIGLEASYLFTSNPNVGNGPAVGLRFSRISWGRGGK
jgi:hypothetical protein